MLVPPRQVLLPAIAFLGLLAVALGRVQAQAQTPQGELYAALTQYLGAVRAGDAAGASAFVDGIPPDIPPDALETHVQALRSLVGQVGRLAVSEDGRGGQAVVTWLDSRGRGRHREVLDWARAPRETWRLERIQVAP